MGFIFCSIARWFEASSHSLLIVFGGGAATIAYTVQRSHRVGKLTGHTEESRGSEDHTCCSNTCNYAKESLDAGTRWVNGSTGSMRSERNIIRYECIHTPYIPSANFCCEQKERKCEGGESEYVPAFFSSMDRVFQSFFWISSSC